MCAVISKMEVAMKLDFSSCVEEEMNTSYPTFSTGCDFGSDEIAFRNEVCTPSPARLFSPRKSSRPPARNTNENLNSSAEVSPPYKKIRALRLFDSPATPKTILLKSTEDGHSHSSSASSVVRPHSRTRLFPSSRTRNSVSSWNSAVTPSPPAALQSSFSSGSSNNKGRTKQVANINPFTPSGMLLSTRKRTRSRREHETSKGETEIPVDMDTSLDECCCDDSCDEYEDEIGRPTKRLAMHEANVSRYNHEFLELSLIGQGEFGGVYKCRHRLDGCIYAIKKSLKPVAGSVNERIALNEVYAHAVLGKHPHVVRYYSAWAENDHMIIQNEYCNGGSLADLVETCKKTGRRLSENFIKQVLLHAAKGLKYIHSQQLVHMDIKSANIFVSREKKVKLPVEDSADDGFEEEHIEDIEEVTYKIGDLGHVTSILNPQVEEGDCRYLPREILQDDFSHLQKADVFALGLTMYEAARGKPLPLNGEEWHKIRNAELEPLPGYSVEFQKLLKQMVHPDPVARPTAVQLVHHPSLCPPTSLSRTELRRELNAERLKNEILSRQLKEAAKCLQSLTPNVASTIAAVASGVLAGVASTPVGVHPFSQRSGPTTRNSRLIELNPTNIHAMDGDDRSDMSDDGDNQDFCDEGNDSNGDNNAGRGSDRSDDEKISDKSNDSSDNGASDCTDADNGNSSNDEDYEGDTTANLNTSSVCEADISSVTTDTIVEVDVNASNTYNDQIENRDTGGSWHNRGRGGRRPRGRKYNLNNRGGGNAQVRSGNATENPRKIEDNRSQGDSGCSSKSNIGRFNRGGKQFNRGSGNFGKRSDSGNDSRQQISGNQNLFIDSPLKFDEGKLDFGEQLSQKKIYDRNPNSGSSFGKKSYTSSGHFSNSSKNHGNNSSFDNRNNTSNNHNKRNSSGSNNYNNYNDNSKKHNNSSGNDKNSKNKNNVYDDNSKNFLKYVTLLINPFWRRREKAEPIDSFVLKLHYSTSVCIFLLLFFVVQGNWFLREAIKCISGHDPQHQLDFHKINFCLSYAYICEPDMNSADHCRRRYLLFYRWLYLCFLLVSAIYYLPRFLAKKMMNPRLKKLLTDLSYDEDRYDSTNWETDAQKMLIYMESHRRRNSQYVWLIVCHILALGIDVAVITFFNFLLHDRFLELMYAAYPYHRELPYFSDYISQTFPPFANCTIHVENLINNQREERFGCYLYLMELYEKLFVVVWVWLATLTVVTVVSLVVLIILALPPFSCLFLHLYSTSDRISCAQRKIMRMCSVSDLYALYLMKRYRSEDIFVKFLTKFVQNYEESLQEVIVSSKGVGVIDDKSSRSSLEGDWSMQGRDWSKSTYPNPALPCAPKFPDGLQYPPMGFVSSSNGQDFRFRKANHTSPSKRMAPPPPLHPLRLSNQKFKNDLEPIQEVP
ncbi:Mitosis inhibitor protein kinase wee1 [Halocaridina rubra]|uniref:Innexin n=1 Tax=Halocaridina rubra TaxID=373956 RepID=A0AAN8XNN6_HALRR